MKAAIIGCGFGGGNHAFALRKNNIEISALCDIRASQAAKINEQYCDGKAKFFSSVDELVAEANFDIGVVATPDHQHLYPLKTMLKTGRWCFVDKPLVTTMSDVLDVQRLMEKYSGKLLYSEKFSFSTPLVAAYKHRAELGEFVCGRTLFDTNENDGTPGFMGTESWRGTSAYNPAAGTMTHNFTSLLRIIGEPIVAVSAHGEVVAHEHLKKYGGYDIMKGICRLQNDRTLTFEAILATLGKGLSFRHRRVVHPEVKFTNGYLAYNPDPLLDELRINDELIPFEHEALTSKEWGPYVNGLLAEMWADVFSGIDGKKTVHTTQDGLHVAVVCALAFESAQNNGKWMEVPTEFYSFL